MEALAGGEAGGVEGDSGLLEDFVAGRESPPERLRAALRRATLSGRATPVLCGSAFSDGSAALLLDAVSDYLPAPDEAVRPEAADPATGEAVVLGPDGPFSGFVFKTGGDRDLGRLSWLRVRSGRVAAGDRVLDVGAGRIVRVTRIFGIHADRLEDIAEASDGDIVALALAGQGTGVASAGSTGSTLCDPREPILYEPISFDEPVVSLALEPRTREDGERLRKGAAALADEDPSIRLREDPQTGRIELSGMGELHLEVAAERLARGFGARFRAGKPRVSYREVLESPAVAEEDFDRDLGGERARAKVGLRLERAGAGTKGFSFEVEPDLRLSAVLTEAVRRGAEAALSVGPTRSYPLRWREDRPRSPVLARRLGSPRRTRYRNARSRSPPPSPPARLSERRNSSRRARNAHRDDGARVLSGRGGRGDIGKRRTNRVVGFRCRRRQHSLGGRSAPSPLRLRGRAALGHGGQGGVQRSFPPRRCGDRGQQ